MADLETLRLRFEALTAPAAKNILELNRQLSAHKKLMQSTAEGNRAAATASRAQAAATAAATAKLREQAAAIRLARLEQDELGKGLSFIMKGGQFLTAIAVVNRLHNAVKAVFGAVEEAARTQTAKMYFDEAGRSLERLRAVSKGMISDADLVKKSNLADSMGLSEDVFENLIRVAQAASAKTGQSFDHMFDSIVLGTARSSRLLLDNLGIIVNVKEANREYAREAIANGEAQGKTIDQVVKAMGAEHKQLAFLNAMHKATAGQLEELDRLGQGGAATFDKWAAAIDNLKNQLTVKLLPAIELILSKLTDVANAISFNMRASSFQDEFEEKSDLGMPTGKAFVPGLGGFDLATGLSRDTTELYSKALERFHDLEAIVNVTSGGMLGLDNAIDPVTYNLTGFAKSIMETEFGMEGLVDHLENLSLAARALGIKPVAAKKPARPELDFGEGEGGGEEDRDILGRLQKWREKWAKEEEDAQRDLADAWLHMLKDVHADTEAYAKRIQEASRKAWMVGGSMDLSLGNTQPETDQEARARQASEDLAKAAEKLSEYERNAVSGVNMAGTAVSGNTGAVVEMVGGLIGAAAGSPAIGSAIGSVLAPFLENMGGLTDVVMGLFNGFQLLVNHALAPLLNTLAPLGPALEDLLAAVGILIGSALRPFLIIFELLIPLVALVVDAITAVVVGASPLIEIIATLVMVFGELILWALQLFGLDFGTDAMISFAYWMGRAGDTAVNAAIKFNNVIVDFVRFLGDLLQNKRLKEWGDKLSWEDFVLPDQDDDPTDDNTDAVEENTRAIKDLAREFHNLPSGYKGNAAIYNATNPEAPYYMRNVPSIGWRNDNVVRNTPGGSAGVATRISNPFRG